jgi:hypothetical protein
MSDNSNRIIKGTFTIKLFGYIVPDTVQKDVTAIKKYNSKAQVIIGLETVNNIAEVKPPIKKLSPIFIDDQQIVVNYIDPAVLNYINTNIQRLGTYVNPTTVTFASGWLAAPSGLPATSLNNFSIFCNGALIENEAIVSFTVNGANNLTTLVIDPNELGYSFDLQDEVVAIGKFNS